MRAHSVRQTFSSSTSEAFLEISVNADGQLHGFSRNPSVQIAINSLSVMWPQSIGRCSNFLRNLERDTTIRILSGILMCGGFERFESLRFLRS